MTDLFRTLPPEIWFAQIFAAKAAQRGTVVRRSVRDVERVMGRDRFEQMIRQRGCRAIQNGSQYIICCNRDPIRIIE